MPKTETIDCSELFQGLKDHFDRVRDLLEKVSQQFAKGTVHCAKCSGTDDLKQILDAFDKSIENWHENHNSIPTAFLPLAIVIDEIRRKSRIQPSPAEWLQKRAQQMDDDVNEYEGLRSFNAAKLSRQSATCFREAAERARIEGWIRTK